MILYDASNDNDSQHRTTTTLFKEPTPIINGHASPYYFEKHMLQDPYDSNGIRQGSWEVGLCNFMACLPMALCCCLGLPSVSIAQMMVRLGLRSYTRALVKELLIMVFIFGLPFTAYFSLEEVKKHKDGDAKAIPGMLGLWASGTVWVMVVFFNALKLSALRFKIRARFQIPASSCGDIGDVLFLPTCAIAQMSAHLRCIRPGRYSLHCPDMLPPYDY